MTDGTLQRVLLVGFMGAGKTTVGRRLASRLGWRFIDFDDVIEADQGMRVPEIFAVFGEPHFRAVEERVGQALLARDRVVLGSGGGWAAVEGRLEGVPAGTETFWLAVTPEVAVQRAARTPGSRPLLGGEDPLGAARRLVADRERAYRRARWKVDTTGISAEDVASRILDILAREYPKLVIS